MGRSGVYVSSTLVFIVLLSKYLILPVEIRRNMFNRMNREKRVSNSETKDTIDDLFLYSCIFLANIFLVKRK